MRSRAKTVSDVLFEIAEGQQGYFTAKQAADAGYQLGSQAYHVKSENWVRVERGIYRLAGLDCVLRRFNRYQFVAAVGGHGFQASAGRSRIVWV